MNFKSKIEPNINENAASRPQTAAEMNAKRQHFKDGRGPSERTVDPYAITSNPENRAQSDPSLSPTRDSVEREAPGKRLTGSVISWTPSPMYGFHGYIQCSDESTIQGLLLVNRTSLRSPDVSLKAGDKVNFVPRRVIRGFLATDVVRDSESETYEGADPEDPTSYVRAKMLTVRPDRYFGILELPDGRTALLHFSELENPENPPPLGSIIKCRLEQKYVNGVQKLEAREASVITSAASAPVRKEQFGRYRVPSDQIGLALLAREEGKFEKAAEIYERAMKNSPSPQVILSYAAMERGRGNAQTARAVFERGITQFPQHPKLHEDYGLLEASTNNFSQAMILLKKALDLSRRPNQLGEKGILLNLARVHYRMAEGGDKAAVVEAVRYYEWADRTFRPSGLPFEKDRRNWALAKFQAQHHRGAIALQFFKAAGFDAVRADLSPGGGDLLIRSHNPEILENYAFSSPTFLAHCVFQPELGLADLNKLDDKIACLSKNFGTEEAVAFLVISSLTPEIQRTLTSRISDRREHSPAIVPVSQEEIERSTDALKTLRNALDKWLFQRDLFATNAPVRGDRFFGRANPLAEIGDAVSASKSVGIFGLRKVGKTSLLHELRRRSTDSGDVVLYLDLLGVPEGVTDTAWIYWELANQMRTNSAHLNPNFKWRLGAIFENALDIPGDFKTAIAFDSDLKNLLRVIASTPINPRPKVVLMLDEIERLLPNRLGEPGFMGFFAFFSYFRGLSQQTIDFTMIVTAANPGIQEAAQFDSRDNPVFNYFHEIYLKLLEHAECVKMITTLGQGMGLRFEKQSCERIYQLTGGHPFITRMFCSYLAEIHKLRPLKVTATMADGALDNYLDLKGDKDFNEIFQRLNRDYPDERDVCLKLAHSVSPVALDSVAKEKIRHLIGYQLVRADGRNVTLSMELMKLWLQRNYADSENIARNS